MNEAPTPLLSVRDLRVSFAMDEGLVRAVDGTSFDVMPGQVLGVVGESGCGKSVTMKAILQLVERPGRITSGEIRFRRRGGREPIDLLLENDEMFHTLRVDYHGGERYPHLVRDESKTDWVSAIGKPLTPAGAKP